MIIHLSFQHFFEGVAEEILERILDIQGSFRGILLNEPPDEGPFALSHLRVGCCLFLCCHIKASIRESEFTIEAF